VPSVIAPYVAATIGPRRTASLFMTGRMFGAQQALAMGLVDEVTDDLAGAAERLAREFFENGPEAVREAKRLVWDTAFHARDGGIEDIARRYARNRLGEEGREGLAATLEQRRPNWSPQ
jgi:methylglutaconyl-CoA hydratase